MISSFDPSQDLRAPRRLEDAWIKQLQCSVCGCTENAACVDQSTGETCYWIIGKDAPVCSFCVAADSRVEVYSEADAANYIRAMKAGAG